MHYSLCVNSDYHLNPVFTGALKEKLYISYTLTLTKDKDSNKFNKTVRQSIVALLKDHSMSMTKQYNMLCLGMDMLFLLKPNSMSVWLGFTLLSVRVWCVYKLWMTTLAFDTGWLPLVLQ